MANAGTNPVDRHRILKYTDRVLRLGLAFIFIYASLDKLLHPAEFALIIRDYRVLPEALVNITAIILPWLELILGILLIAGLFLDGALLLVNGLLLTFWVTLVFNAWRGLDISCGCFSTSPSSTTYHASWYIIRDGLFVLMGLGAALCLRMRRSRRSPAS